jgi:ribosome-interacting GTPase 1
MPANLTPIYKEAEERYKEAKTDEERLAGLVEMLSVLPKHKGTEKIQADLKTRISKLKHSAGAKSGGAKRSSWYQIERQGAGQVALFGPPNTGKSAIVAALSGAPTTVAPYPFSTVAPQAGMMPYEDIQIQLIDTPPIHEDAEPWVYHFLRVADLLILVLDLADDDIIVSIEKLLPCLAKAGIRLRPEGEFPARPLLVTGNKADAEGADERKAIALEVLGSDLPIMPVSTVSHAGLEELRLRIFERLHVIRVYTKRPGHPADMHDPVILPEGSTVMAAAEHLHKDIAAHLKYAKRWDGQVHGLMVERTHVLTDKSVIEFHI